MGLNGCPGSYYFLAAASGLPPRSLDNAQQQRECSMFHTPLTFQGQKRQSAASSTENPKLS